VPKGDLTYNSGTEIHHVYLLVQFGDSPICEVSLSCRRGVTVPLEDLDRRDPSEVTCEGCIQRMKKR
jgi:hypothetical protein